MWPCPLLLLLVCICVGESQYKIQMFKKYMQTTLVIFTPSLQNATYLVAAVELEVYKVKTKKLKVDLNRQTGIYTQE
jgi:hypothetical protein